MLVVRQGWWAGRPRTAMRRVRSRMVFLSLSTARDSGGLGKVRGRGGVTAGNAAPDLMLLGCWLEPQGRVDPAGRGDGTTGSADNRPAARSRKSSNRARSSGAGNHNVSGERSANDTSGGAGAKPTPAGVGCSRQRPVTRRPLAACVDGARTMTYSKTATWLAGMRSGLPVSKPTNAVTDSAWAVASSVKPVCPAASA